MSRDLKSFANYIEQEHGGVLIVGRHAGRFFADVLRDDPEYGEWAAALENPGKLMIGFHDYVKRRQRTRPRDRPQLQHKLFDGDEAADDWAVALPSDPVKCCFEGGV